MRIRSQKKEMRVKAEGHYVDYKEVVKNKYHLLAQYFKCEERRLRMITLVEKPRAVEEIFKKGISETTQGPQEFSST